MINLDKISQIDINNIDVAKITKILIENQKMITIVFILGSLMMVWGMFNEHRVKEQGMRTQITQAQGKLDVIKARDAAIAGIADFKTTIPKDLNVFDVISIIRSDAKTCNSYVSSYTPSSQAKDMGLYSDINVHFEMVSDNFKDMVLFLRKVEKSKYPIIINTWTGHEGDDGKVVYSIDTSAVNIHP